MKAHHGLVADFLPFSWVDGPGNRAVVFMQGCNFNCLACHNPQTIPLKSKRARKYSVREMVEKIRASTPFISGVTFSGGEAMIQNLFIKELFTAIKNDPGLKHLTNFIDSNGSATQAAWEDLIPVTDGVMVDLKAIDPEKHIALTKQSIEPVLKSIEYLAAAGKLYEVRLLLVPNQNDSDEELRKTVGILLGIDQHMRIKINNFMVHGVRSIAKQWPEVQPDDENRYRLTLKSTGARLVV
jgi:pyruvate formate lyase activating enzyme